MSAKWVVSSSSEACPLRAKTTWMVIALSARGQASIAEAPSTPRDVANPSSGLVASHGRSGS
eukprot:6184655-Amphidinium_carterae.1